MKKSRLAASVLAVSVAVSTLLTGCTQVPETSDNSSSTGNTSSDNNSSSTGGNTSSDNNSTDNNSEPAPPAASIEFASGTVLRMATGYNNKNTGLFFDADYVTDKGTNGSITLADGKTYNSGDLKPTWVAVQEKLGMVFENKYQGNGAADEWAYWKDQLDQVDMVSGTASGLSEAGAAGLVVNLADHLDEMPNFKAYLDANPIVRLSIAGDDGEGGISGIYFSPYFDGVNDIERMPLMRVDWVQKLLDGDDFTAENSGTTATPAYQPYMPTSGKVTIDVVKKDGSATETVTKDYDKAGNIIDKMNAAGAMSGVDAVKMLRTYIDEAYGGYYGTTRSDLFCGQNAAWDADELVALLRCVVANSQTLNGTDTVNGLFSRQENSNQRRVDMFRFAGTLFGVRGLESRQDYLYIGTDNKLHDARQEEDAYLAVERMYNMAKEGLISADYMTSAETKSEQYLENDAGFMSYDYNQTQTLLNKSKLQDGEKYMAAMVPVALWNDGTEKYMRFTESWRSVKTDGWAISAAGVAGNEDKLNAALALIDYAFSEEGQLMMSYGPEAFRSTETFEFNGKTMPKISDATYAELWEKEGGNYTNYARRCLGSTLSFVKSQAFEYQCTHEVGREGAGYISNAIAKGTIKHPELALADNPWYTSVPTTLPTSKAENDIINGFAELGSGGKFSQKDKQENLFVDIIVGGFSGDGTTNAAECAATTANAWNGAQYLSIKQGAWEILLEDFASL